MNNATQKYHLYMDETSSFEWDLEKKKPRPPIIYALLVPDDEHNKLGRNFVDLRKLHGFTKAIHGIDHYKKDSYKNLCSDLVDLTTDSKIMSFAITYEKDLFTNCPAELQDSFAANRFLSMAQLILEYIIFLHPSLHGCDISFSIKPNSRVISVYDTNKDETERLELLGFDSAANPPKNSNLRYPNKNYQSKSSHRYYIWGTDSLRSYLHRMFLEYAPWSEKIGQRSWGNVQTIVASRSDDPFVEWVDILAGVYGWDKRVKLTQKLKNSLFANLQYGPQHQYFKELAKLYLGGNFQLFLSQTLRHLLSFTEVSYRASLKHLCSKAISEISSNDFLEIQQLEQYVKTILKESRGEHTLAYNILLHIENAIGKLPENVQQQHATQLLKFRINSHKISIHNHRGEFTQALDAYYEAKDLDLSPLDIADYRERIEIENRLAVSVANVFAFHEGTTLLEPLLARLEESLQPLSDKSGLVLADSLIGKLRGTLGQNYAFLALSNPESFEKAEDLFIKAAQEFSSDADKLRHDINFFHLYTDWQKPDMAQECIDEIVSSETLAPFIAEQNSETAKGVQFALLAYIKHSFITKQNFESLLQVFSLQKMKDLFRESITEHPFQFICAYLGRMAISLNKNKTASSLFAHALKMPLQGNRKEQPTLEAIRAQILVLQALGEGERQRNKAQKNVIKAITIMEGLGTNPDYYTMLAIKKDETTGWFAKGWQALKSVDWHKDFDPNACQTFLDCFTFNYH